MEISEQNPRGLCGARSSREVGGSKASLRGKIGGKVTGNFKFSVENKLFNFIELNNGSSNSLQNSIFSCRKVIA